MAYFRLRTDAQNWFSEIADKPPFRTKFDIYYLCLLAGIASGRAVELSGAANPATDVYEKYPEDFRPAGRLIIGLLVTAELKKSGIDVSEKAQVRALFKRLVDSETPNNLTDMGMRRLNSYASGGYEFLAEQRDMKPYTAEEFIQSYTALIGDAVEKATLA